MDAGEVILIMLNGFWLFLPAMSCNSSAALVGGGTKIDFGKTWNGKRIFGDGKTWRGLFGGILLGILLGLLMMGIAYLCGDEEGYWRFGEFPASVGIVACMCAGSLLGDLCGAFIKRRIGMERGKKAPFLDQYDFVVGSMALTALFFPDFIFSTYFEGWHLAALAFLLVMTYAIHRGVNIIGYKMGIKKEPW